MNYENFTFRKIIISSTFFAFSIFSFVIFSSLVTACVNPGLRTDTGTPINPFGGVFIVNGSEYPGSDVLLINYNMQVRNANINEGMFVWLEAENGIRDYVQSPSVYIPANSVGVLPLQVWIGGLSKAGKLSVFFQCDNSPQFIQPFVYIVIYGKGISPPPASSCSSPRSLNGCYQGLYRSYSCSAGQLTYASACTTFCCKSYGGEDAVCSSDKSTCFSSNNLPTPTEGKIALLCNSEDCDKGIEKKIWFLLRLKGWDVVGKRWKDWTLAELQQYDIIACTENSPCDIDFNSVAYNAHFDKRKPFLEIRSGNGAKAAYSFDYVSTSSGRTVRIPQVNYNNIDPLTSGVSSPGIFINGNNFAGVEGKKLKEEIKWFGNSTDNENVLLFKVKENVAHGRYAYVGMFVKSSLGDMTVDGEKVLNNTLKWLKCGDACFGGTNNNAPRKGSIAYICSNDKCTSTADVDMIKFLRSIGYSVEGDSLKNWQVRDLTSYNIFLCASAVKCKILNGTNISNAHLLDGKNFVEFATSSKINAAYNFGYIDEASGKRKSSVNVSFNGANEFSIGLSNPFPFTVNKRSRSMVGLETPVTSPIADVAHVNYKNEDKNISTVFYLPASGGHGRYSFVGWTGRFDPDNLNSNGKLLLERSINYANCGNISC